MSEVQVSIHDVDKATYALLRAVFMEVDGSTCRWVDATIGGLKLTVFQPTDMYMAEREGVSMGSADG